MLFEIRQLCHQQQTLDLNLLRCSGNMHYRANSVIEDMTITVQPCADH